VIDVRSEFERELKRAPGDVHERRYEMNSRTSTSKQTISPYQRDELVQTQLGDLGAAPTEMQSNIKYD